MRPHAHATSLLLLAALCSEAAVISEIEIPDRRGDLELVGAGVLRKGFFFRIYAGALYAAEDGMYSPDLTGKAKRLDIYYFHNTPKKYMIKAAEKALRDNLDAAELEQLQPAINRLHAAFIDGREGAVASIVHRPGMGLTYLFNEQELLAIPDDRFADAYFSIWLGERPSSRTMKKALLGLDRGNNGDG